MNVPTKDRYIDGRDAGRYGYGGEELPPRQPAGMLNRMPRQTTEAPATERQVAFLNKLMAERPMMMEVENLYPDNVAKLTKRQCSSKIDEVLKTPKESRQPAARPATGDTHELPREGTYTLVKPDGTYRTLQFTRPKWAEGKLVVQYLSGPDNNLSYTGFAFVLNTGRVAIWRKFRDDSTLVADLNMFLGLEDRDGAHREFLNRAEAYALASKNCMACGRKLSVPVSLHRGLGPVCAGREGF